MREPRHETNVVLARGKWHVFVRRPFGDGTDSIVTQWHGAFRWAWFAHLVAWANRPR